MSVLGADFGRLTPPCVFTTTVPYRLDAKSLQQGLSEPCLTTVFFVPRFLFSDLQPLTEVGTAPDPHPEGPSSIPTEAPADIRKELAIERRREGLRKAAVSTRLPRLTQVWT